MNKSELIEHLAQEAELSKASATRVMDALIAALQDAMQRGDSVTIVGLGTFVVSTRAARMGRNPRTGEPVSIKRSRAVKFRAGKALKAMLA